MLSASMGWYERVAWEYRLKCTARGYYRLGTGAPGERRPFRLLHKREDGPEERRPARVPGGGVAAGAGHPVAQADGRRPQRTPHTPGHVAPGDGARLPEGRPPEVGGLGSSAPRRGGSRSRVFDPSSSTTIVAGGGHRDEPDKLGGATRRRCWSASSGQPRRWPTTRRRRGPSWDCSPTARPSAPTGPWSSRPAPSRTISRWCSRPSPPSRRWSCRPCTRGWATTRAGSRWAPPLVIVTAMVDPELVAVIGTLKRRGHPIVVLYVAEGACPEMPEGVIVHELGEHLQRAEEASEFGPG